MTPVSCLFACVKSKSMDRNNTQTSTFYYPKTYKTIKQGVEEQPDLQLFIEE